MWRKSFQDVTNSRKLMGRCSWKILKFGKLFWSKLRNPKNCIRARIYGKIRNLMSITLVSKINDFLSYIWIPFCTCETDWNTQNLYFLSVVANLTLSFKGFFSKFNSSSCIWGVCGFFWLHPWESSLWVHSTFVMACDQMQQKLVFGSSDNELRKHTARNLEELHRKVFSDWQISELLDDYSWYTNTTDSGADLLRAMTNMGGI